MRLTALLPAVAALVLACEPGPGAGSRVDLLAHAVMTARVGDEARLRVAFLPTPESCSPQDLIASKALARLAEEEEQVAVLTVVPRGLPEEVGMAGLPFPGTVVDLPMHTLNESSKAPRPRFEIYGPGGQLLVMRPVYPYEEGRSLVEEIIGLLRYANVDST